MAFFNDLFAKDKKKADEAALEALQPKVPEPVLDPTGGPTMNQPDPGDVPVDHVVTMRNQGLNNNQIIQSLQRYGYSIDQINNALNQADIKVGVQSPFGAGPGAAMPHGGPQHDPSPFGPGGSMTHGAPAPQQAPPGPAAHGGPMTAAPMHGGGLPPESHVDTGIPSNDEEKMHEIAEAIIEEKWGEITEHIEKIITWKESTEQKFAKMETDIAHLKESFDKLHEGILGKIGDYDKNLSAVGTEIKALEKVFQKILPGFVDNVQELSRITKRVKNQK